MVSGTNLSRFNERFNEHHRAEHCTATNNKKDCLTISTTAFTRTPALLLLHFTHTHSHDQQHYFSFRQACPFRGQHFKKQLRWWFTRQEQLSGKFRFVFQQEQACVTQESPVPAQKAACNQASSGVEGGKHDRGECQECSFVHRFDWISIG